MQHAVAYYVSRNTQTTHHPGLPLQRLRTVRQAVRKRWQYRQRLILKSHQTGASSKGRKFCCSKSQVLWSFGTRIVYNNCDVFWPVRLLSTRKSHRGEKHSISWGWCFVTWPQASKGALPWCEAQFNWSLLWIPKCDRQSFKGTKCSLLSTTRLPAE